MQEMLEELYQHIRGVWLRRRYILILSWILCPVGWALVTMMPNQYTSEARVYADTRSILQPLLRGLTYQTDPTRELQLMVKTLLSRSNLERIARDIDADIRAETDEEYEEIISDLEKNIEIRSTGRENLYTISYSGKEAAFTKDVVQATLNVFVENTLSEQRQDTDQANQIISGQIKDYERRLLDAESKLADFKREYRGFLPGSDTDYYSQLEMNKVLLEEAQLALTETNSRLANARNQLKKGESEASAEASRVRTEYDDRIDILQQRLDDLLFRYTARHPDVKETQRQLDELKQLKKDSIDSYSVNEMLMHNVVYQDLKLAVSQLQNEAASLGVRVQRYETKIEQLQAKLDAVPEVEAKLTALTRNYDVTRDKYQQLLSRKESALISQSVGDTSDDIKFRIIDAPRIPLEPSGPIRPLLLSVVLILGLGAGVVMSFIVSQITPVVSSTRQLYQAMEYPVFGVVSATERSGLHKWAKRKTRFFMLANLLLIGLFAAFIVLNARPDIQDRMLQQVSQIQGMNLL